jgi:hypothetical protein
MQLTASSLRFTFCAFAIQVFVSGESCTGTRGQLICVSLGDESATRTAVAAYPKRKCLLGVRACSCFHCETVEEMLR